MGMDIFITVPPLLAERATPAQPQTPADRIVLGVDALEIRGFGLTDGESGTIRQAVVGITNEESLIGRLGLDIDMLQGFAVLDAVKCLSAFALANGMPASEETVGRLAAELISTLARNIEQNEGVK